MSEIDLLKKIFMEKEKENLRLKNELNQAKSGIFKQNDQSITQTGETNKSSYFSNNHPQTDLNEPDINYKSMKIDDLSKLVNENAPYNKVVKKKHSRTKSQLVVNIENQIGELNRQINNFEIENDKIEDLNRLVRGQGQNDNSLKLEIQIEDLKLKLKLKEEEKNQLKEMYEKELSIKSEIYNQNIKHITRTHQEEIKKMRVEHETKMEEVIKKSEEEKIMLINKANSIEKELLNYKSATILEEKTDMIDFQKKYLSDMKILQKNFEDFKVKTYEQLKISKEEKDEAIKKYKYYKESLSKLSNTFRQCENQYLENIRKMNEKLSFTKSLIEKNEELSRNFQNTKKEESYLKLQVEKLKNSERKLHNLLMEKLNQDEIEDFKRSRISDQVDPLEIKMSNMFSPVNNYQSTSNNNGNKNNRNIEYNQSTLYDNNENDSNSLDLYKAKEKIRLIEGCLKDMTNENDELKNKFDSVLNRNSEINFNSYYNTPLNRQTSTKSISVNKKDRNNQSTKYETKNNFESNTNDINPYFSCTNNNNSNKKRVFQSKEKRNSMTNLDHLTKTQFLERNNNEDKQLSSRDRKYF